ncbi:IS66 family insertion sequence element accessory protein TnpB [Salmonella enterica]|nr:transposase [Salmonella enterica]ECC9413380.1 transposase [Salmonella enterica subsp. enterica]EHF1447207.1 IS66 family insertion sequence element accessory protein TnpB [Salmonella enterica subsp. enterica serovar 4,5,12:b:-]EHG1527830.1 IS66 family insertion sequence element accessory protein TnpB [Salmonella enterica subsp. enterica serovar 4,[5],12:b:-]ECD8847281.1 IS66 family insertion sequence element accessory protein TnpB [Salmonella enterica subsp. enterica]
MLTPEHLFLVRQPVDMRCGIDVLTQYIRASLSLPWQDGAAFLFTNKTRTRIKLLRWDRHGVWLCARRLHQGYFTWPRDGDIAWSLTPEQFDWLIAGIDWQKMSGHDMTKWT